MKFSLLRKITPRYGKRIPTLGPVFLQVPPTLLSSWGLPDRWSPVHTETIPSLLDYDLGTGPPEVFAQPFPGPAQALCQVLLPKSRLQSWCAYPKTQRTMTKDWLLVGGVKNSAVGESIWMFMRSLAAQDGAQHGEREERCRLHIRTWVEGDWLSRCCHFLA